ncbi:protein kinase [Rhypophila sp. PSN 637]
MDPISLAGLGLGAVSLAFELFSSCIKGYNLILEANNMPKTCRHLLVRLQMEKEKLLGWAVLARLSDDDGLSSGPGLRLNSHTVIDALREIQVLLLDFVHLQKRYGLALVPASSTSGDQITTEEGTSSDTAGPTILRDDYSKLQRKALRFIDKTRKYPRKLQWAVFDKGQFETFLANLRALNDNMMGFLEAYERNRHLQMQEATFMQILQVNNKVGDLFELLHSLRDTSKAGAGVGQGTLVGLEERAHNDRSRLQTHEDRLIRLTRFKAVSIAIEAQPDKDPLDWGGSTQSSETTQMDITIGSRVSQLGLQRLGGLSSKLNANSDRPPRSSAVLDNDRPVWVEWRYYERVIETDDSDDDGNDNLSVEPPPFVKERISRLAKLLGDELKPSEFLVPDCLGFLDDGEKSRLGFVFKSLPGSQVDSFPPITLLEVLASTRKPSLTTRVRIARMVATSIWYLHATNWLHKGMRSQNIVFSRKQQGAAQQLDGHAEPFICGFDYSRPANIGEETERPVENLLHDMYRHPDVQFDVPREGRRGFNKLHDVYSLGVVLYEIAVWKPVYAVLGITDMSLIRASTAKSVTSSLTGAPSREMLEAEIGDVAAEAIMSCLDGSQSLMGKAREDMMGVESNARLQFAFGEKVVKRLESVSI